MKANEFAYWLQGFFEINGSDAALTAAQAKAILAKTEKVELAQGNPQTLAFVAYAKGSLSTASRVASDELLKVVTDDLKTKLNAVFVHEIDPSYEGDQNQFGKIHRPNGPDFTVRC